jgi:hypothetical protein
MSQKKNGVVGVLCFNSLSQNQMVWLLLTSLVGIPLSYALCNCGAGAGPANCYNGLVANSSASCSVCTPIGPGYYTPNIYTTYCVSGGSGTIAPSCTAGTYSTGGANTCTNCPAGLYNTQAALSSCLACAAGYYSNPASTQCLVCTQGYFSNAGAGSCTPCPAGKLSSGSGLTSCSSCSAGAFATGGASVCTTCPPGSYNMTSSASTCTACNSGSYSPGGNTPCANCTRGLSSSSGSITCGPCDVGLFSSSDGSSSCSLCRAGFFNNQTSSSTCLPCTAGYFSISGSTICTACRNGTFSLQSAGRCTNCSEGFFSNASSASYCQTCTPGLFQGSRGTTYCSSCSPGLFSPRPSSTSCTECPIGRYIEISSSTSCLTCPGEGSTTRFAGIPRMQECVCPQGFYGNPLSGKKCKPCQQTGDEAVNRPAGTIIPSIGKGYFRDPDDPGLPVKCWPSESCQFTGIANQTSCNWGYTGYACSMCQLYVTYRSGIGCEKCSSVVVRVFIVIVVVAVLFKAMARLFDAKTGVIPEMKILLNSLQMIGLFSRSPIRWIGLMASVIATVSITNLDIDMFSPGCDLNLTYWNKLYLRFFLPHFFFVVALVYFVLKKKYLKKTLSLEKYAKLARTKDVIFSAFVATNVGFYSLFINTLVDPFRCLDQENGRSVLAAEPSTLCFEKSWWDHVSLVIVLLVTYLVFFPVGLGFLLFKNRNNFSSKKNQVRYGFLVNHYRKDFYWWDIIVIYERALFFVAMNFLTNSDSANSKTFLSIAVIMMFICVQVVVAPFHIRARNVLSVV